MKRLSLLMTLMSSIVFADTHPPHLDLEMTSAEYKQYLKGQSRDKEVGDPRIDAAIALGEKLSKWIALVNTNRGPENAIRLTSPTTRRAIPIDRPNKYSPSIIQTETTSILNELPAAIKEVLASTDSLPSNLPVDDETFILHARRIDRNYQSAARYKSLIGWLPYYVEAAKKDVRGYYYLTSNKISANELRDVATISAEKLGPIKTALAQICLNSNVLNCKEKVENAFKENKASEFYSRYYSNSKKIWDDFFIIPRNARRSDLHWTDTISTVPFNTPKIAKFIPYLQTNIEDEFRFNDWALKINFGEFTDGPRLTFEPGVVPHVNGLGGNEIVMDSNQPIEEYESQWTIRHEFGHVIGLPDCYHEFFDVEQNVFINYQLDISDLMCSRAGNMNERIYKELRRVYKR